MKTQELQQPKPVVDPVDLLPDATKNEMLERTDYWDGVLK